MAETGSCVVAAGAAALAGYGVGQVGLWLLRVPARGAWENLTLAVGLGTAVWCLTLALLDSAGALSVPVVDLLTLGSASIGVWGVAACWLRVRIATQTSTPWPAAESRWPSTASPLTTLGLVAAAAALVQALAPPLPGNELAAEILRSSAGLQPSGGSGPLPLVDTFALTGPLVLGGPGACSVFRWILTALAAAAAGLAVELPGRQAQGCRCAGRGIAAVLVLASPIACSAQQTAGGVLVGAWLAIAWFAWRRSLCEPSGGRWRLLALVVGAAAVASMGAEMYCGAPSDGLPAAELFHALGPLLASAAPVAVLVLGVHRCSTAVLGLVALALGTSSSLDPGAAAWAAPLLAASAAQAVIALDAFRLPVRRWATAALAAALAVQAALPLVAARGVWAVALGREERDDYLSHRLGEFRAVRLLDAMARRQSLVYSDQAELLYYDGPRPQSVDPSTRWLPEELNRPVYFLHVEPPSNPAGAQRWLAARGLSVDHPSLTPLLDYEFDDGEGPRRRYRLLRLAPESAQRLAAAPPRLPESIGDRAAAPEADDVKRR